MRVTEAMIRKNNLKREQEKKRQSPEPDHFELNKTWETEKRNFFNSPGPVQDSKMESGLNMQQSLFDSQATFRSINRR